MNIAIDITPVSSTNNSGHKVRGIGKYIEELISGLKKYDKKNKYTFFTKGEKLPKEIDLVHFPYFEPFFVSLPLINSVKTVVTIHDLTPIVFKKHFPVGIRGELRWQLQKFLASRTDFIITDSQASEKDIHAIIKKSKSKTEAVYLAAGDEFGIIKDKDRLEQVMERYKLPQKFVLYVGDATWNKNLPNLINAVEKLNIPLVLVGKAIASKNFDERNPWNKDLMIVKEKISKNDKLHALGFVPSDDLAAIYNLATVFVMPSLYEGFGLPVIEAMKSGCPVVASSLGSLGEIAGDAALLVDPISSDDIASKIKKVYEDYDLQKKLILKGTKRAENFSWEKTAKKTIEIYEKTYQS